MDNANLHHHIYYSKSNPLHITFKIMLIRGFYKYKYHLCVHAVNNEYCLPHILLCRYMLCNKLAFKPIYVVNLRVIVLNISSCISYSTITVYCQVAFNNRENYNWSTDVSGSSLTNSIFAIIGVFSSVNDGSSISVVKLVRNILIITFGWLKTLRYEIKCALWFLRLKNRDLVVKSNIRSYQYFHVFFCIYILI